jgi:hypothetical protein
MSLGRASQQGTAVCSQPSKAKGVPYVIRSAVEMPENRRKYRELHGPSLVLGIILGTVAGVVAVLMASGTIH